MYSPRFLGGLMLAFSLVSISIASGHYALTCDGQKVGDEPARHWACVNSAGVYSEMKGVWDICVAKGELTACCIEGKDLCASNCKTLPTYPAPPFNKRNCSDAQVGGVDAHNLMCKNKDGIHMVNFGCEKDEETVCCISLPKGQTPKDKDCAAISEK
ncbi:hypothetical protein MJO28_015857 [Puccinia striiformis f. sp. tritici]|uniref:Secreted protein n=3 Tax=Puccinia striiformis TaxID=27350 RepID=A0A0L0USI5_9BASI|nr:hypothetical protein Pst134EA_029188 [Puccinia striiformis f. sp. tritici]KNE90027.1 hypothetical protein PSTG_16504 [Puccinia striiformis f. sp. tritici PST-78]POW09512.1 hypothetical protein PSTT_06705 [Puccinia striiformis]KAH9441175.1 hypothetical protein Pst134EB_029845 [Puccinia striiformis f. sp. tritici]KAH9447143.1 hypothetical protein Pst134EA_029188 [Puccinia striiformis f. sp. tritici]KAI7936246.1 hypothetical protein MJO29_015549 [Puccinia striiformis f. sp. tritici]